MIIILFVRIANLMFPSLPYPATQSYSTRAHDKKTYVIISRRMSYMNDAGDVRREHAPENSLKKHVKITKNVLNKKCRKFFFLFLSVSFNL